LAEVIGVVRNVRDMPAGDFERERVYVNADRHGAPTINVFVQGSGRPDALVAAARDAIQRLEPAMVITGAMSMSEYVDKMFFLQRTMALTMLIMGLIGTMVTGVGVFAVVQQAVTSRRREVAIRLCLGAGRARIITSLIAKSAGLVLLGTAGGLGLAILSAKIVARLTFDVPLETVAGAVSVLFVLAVGLVSCAMPAVRAGWASPVRWLRLE
jgi:ABC-type antimicrobial peptide transport system permease subunit